MIVGRTKQVSPEGSHKGSSHTGHWHAQAWLKPFSTGGISPLLWASLSSAFKAFPTNEVRPTQLGQDALPSTVT